ncbi:MAG: DUF1549 domain-containing protein [Planctomycetales bacterium]
MALTCRWTHLSAAVLLLGLLAVNPLARAADDVEGAAPGQSSAAKPLSDDEFFQKKIEPLLAARCLECHGAEKQKGNLRLDRRTEALAGGDSGPSVVPRNPGESLLIQAVRYAGDLKMPPKSKLPEAEIGLLVEWVERGAPWPGTNPPAGPPSTPSETKSGPLFSEEERRFWAFQPIGTAPPPAVRQAEWVQSPIDRFVLADLEAHGLAPARPADKRTLIRRATLDLTGLPPTREEVAAFLADESHEAYAALIDRLLASPRYGERWGRHWLDVARYADSNGLDENLAYANAWRYRDYVVRAFNRDKPFDQFVHEQIAGDLLPATADLNEQLERTTATGFLSLGGKMLAEDDPVKMQMDIVDEQVDTISRAFLGLTLGCARCHDHKYDPVPQEDYDSLAAIFKSTKTMENFSVVARWQERPLASPEEIARRDAHQQQIAGKKGEITRITDQENAALLEDARRHTASYLLAAASRLQWETLIKEAQSLGDTPDDSRRAGQLLIEAEEYARGNVLQDRDNYGKGIGVLVNKGELPNFAEYEVTVENGGPFQCEIRYAAAAARPCRLIINGRTVKSDVAGKVTGTWFPDSQKWFVEGFFPLQAGKNVIRLENAQVFPHIDKLLFVPARRADGTPVELAAPPTAAGDGYESKGEFVAQWVKTLEGVRETPESPLGLWLEAIARNSVPEGSTATGTPPRPADAVLLAEPRPTTLPELAERYAQLFALAESDKEPTIKPEDAGGKGGESPAFPEPVRDAFRKIAKDPMGPWGLPKNAEEYYREPATAALKTRREELKGLEQALPVLPETMAVSDGKPENLRVHVRGSHLTLAQEVPRQFPRILAGTGQTPLDDSRSGRWEFARWMTSQPLTSRVIVNRVWQWHFGEGLVRSPDNFGRLGERPTHPQLLDYLAGELVREDWSLKRLHRLIMLSSTYQQSTTWNESAGTADPENRLWWRMNRRRLEAEAIRDSILAVGGSLDPEMGGSLLPTPNRQYVTSTANVNPVIYEKTRRAVYLPVVRSALYDVFQAFDFADPSTLNGRRDSTTVAPQALFMLNSALVLKQTELMARTLLADQTLDDAHRLTQLYEQALSRRPTDHELARGLAFIEQYATAAQSRVGAAEGPEDNRRRAWQTLCRTVLASNEFVYVE